MKKLLKKTIRKIFSSIFSIIWKMPIWKIIPPSPHVQILEEKLDYLARTHGVRNLNEHLAIAHSFMKRKGDYPINYAVPRSWTEKVGYYKLNYYARSSLGIMLWHKWLAKKWTKHHIGEQYVIPTFGVWDKVEDIDWNTLPKSFVLKSCGGSFGEQVIVVRDKEMANKKKILTAMRGYVAQECHGFSRKKIIAETLLMTPDGSLPFQYEFYCGRGKPMMCRINCHSQTETRSQSSKLICYDIHTWQKLPIQFKKDSYPDGLVPNNADIEKPKNLDELLRIAAKISSHLPISRIDLYSMNEKIYVGEITLRPGVGYSPIVPVEWDFRLGEGVEIIPIQELDRMILRDKEMFSLDEIN